MTLAVSDFMLKLKVFMARITVAGLLAPECLKNIPEPREFPVAKKGDDAFSENG